MSTATRRPTNPAARIISSPHRAETLTIGWESQAACYNRPEEWWDGDNPRLTDKARSVCLSCPVLAECLTEQMQQECSVVWSRSTVRGGLTGPERVQLFLDQREHGPYDAEEARLLALEALASGRRVEEVVDGEISTSTLKLAQRLAWEDVPMRKPPSAGELRNGTAKERAFGRAQDILEWREAGMTVKTIAAELGIGKETVQDVLRAFTDLAQDGDESAGESGQMDPRVLVDFLSGPDTLLPLDVQVMAVAEAVRRGMSYPDIDKARRVTKGYTATFVSRQRKRYEREGREFPVQAVSPRVLRDEDVLSMRLRYAQGGITDMDLALQYGVPRNVVSHALNGRNYKHVGGPIRSGMSSQGKQAAREWGAGHQPRSRTSMNQKDMEEAA